MTTLKSPRTQIRRGGSFTNRSLEYLMPTATRSIVTNSWARAVGTRLGFRVVLDSRRLVRKEAE